LLHLHDTSGDLVMQIPERLEENVT